MHNSLINSHLSLPTYFREEAKQNHEVVNLKKELVLQETQLFKEKMAVERERFEMEREKINLAKEKIKLQKLMLDMRKESLVNESGKPKSKSIDDFDLLVDSDDDCL